MDNFSFSGKERAIRRVNRTLEYDLRAAATSCSNRTFQTITYLPTSFNLTRDGSTPLNMTCQYSNEYRPEKVEPLLRAECIPVRNNTSCTLNTVWPFVSFSATFLLYWNKTYTSTWRRLKSKWIKTAYKFESVTLKTSAIINTEGTAVFFSEYPDGQRDASFLRIRLTNIFRWHMR